MGLSHSCFPSIGLSNLISKMRDWELIFQLPSLPYVLHFYIITLSIYLQLCAIDYKTTPFLHSIAFSTSTTKGLNFLFHFRLKL